MYEDFKTITIMFDEERRGIESFDSDLKNNPEHKWRIYYMYMVNLSTLIRWDIDNDVFEAYKTNIKSKRYDKEYVLSMFADLPFITVKDFYDAMCNLDHISRCDVIESMEGLKLSVKDKLLDSVNKYNYKRFDRIVDNCDYDFSTCARFAKGLSIIKDKSDLDYVHDMVRELPIDGNRCRYYIMNKFPNIQEIENLDLVDRLSLEADALLNNREKLDEIKAENEEFFKAKVDYLKWRFGLKKYLLDIYLSQLPAETKMGILSNIPSKTYKEYQKIEIPSDCEEFFSLKPMDDPISFLIKLYVRDKSTNEIPENLQADENNVNIAKEKLYPDSKYGFIPEDYFDELNKASGIYDEYFNTELFNEHLRKDKLDEFVKLINYLGDMGYIENNNRTKAILAYRLTGLIRPSGEVIEKIDWDTSTPSRLLALLYLIRHWTRHVNPKYKKCIDFFNNIKAEDVANGSSKTKDAANEFQDFLNMLYGDSLFPIEHEKQRKALKK